MFPSMVAISLTGLLVHILRWNCTILLNIVILRQIDCTILNIYKLERVPKLTFNSKQTTILCLWMYIFSLLGLTCDVLCFASLNCEILSWKIVRIKKNKRCAVRFYVPTPLPFVNINCHIYPFVIKLWYLLATDETVFIKNVSLL